MKFDVVTGSSGPVAATTTKYLADLNIVIPHQHQTLGYSTKLGNNDIIQWRNNSNSERQLL